MTESEKNEGADNYTRDGSSPISPRSSRFEELLDQIPGETNKTPRDSSTNSDNSRFDSLLERIRKNRFDQGDESTDGE